MRRFLLALPLFTLLALTAGAQEAITIKIAHPKPGDRWKVTDELKVSTKATFTVGGNTESKVEVNTKSLAYVDDVIENPKNEKLPNKVKRTYEKAVVGSDGKAQTLPVEGKTVVIEKKGNKYSFTVDGRAVTGDVLNLLDEEFNDPNETEARDVIFPKKPVKPGDTWKVPTEDLVKTLGKDGLMLDKEKTAGTGKLVKAYKKGGKQFGLMEIVVDGPFTSGEKAPVTIKDGKMTMKAIAEGCIDGSAPFGDLSSVIIFDFTGTSQGIDVRIVTELTGKRTKEEVKK